MQFGNLDPAYLLFAGISILVMILVSFIDEHKFNKDYIAEEKHHRLEQKK